MTLFLCLCDDDYVNDLVIKACLDEHIHVSYSIPIPEEDK